MGVCKYCGQTVIDTINDLEATDRCNCVEATIRRNLCRAALQAKEIVDDLFGEGCEEKNIVPLDEKVIECLYGLIDLLAEECISSATLQINGICNIKICRTKNQIKVERTEGRKYSNVAGMQ